MRKLKLYLDTSVISYLHAPDTLEKMEETVVLWEEIKTGKYDIVISELVYGEIEQCFEPKRTFLRDEVLKIKFKELTQTREVLELAKEYVKNGVLSQKSFDDCIHIAYAVIENCDFLVSWNFKHLVNVNTIKGVKIVNAVNDYREISIISPTMLISKEEE